MCHKWNTYFLYSAGFCLLVTDLPYILLTEHNIDDDRPRRCPLGPSRLPSRLLALPRSQPRSLPRPGSQPRPAPPPHGYRPRTPPPLPHPSALLAAFCNCVVIPLAGGWRRYAKTPRSTTSSPLVPASPIACCSGECASEANSGSQMCAKPPYTVENYLTFVVRGIHEERKH